MVLSLITPPPPALPPARQSRGRTRQRSAFEAECEQRTIDFFLVIPAYRESERLPAFLRELLAELPTADFRCQVLVVDDGSGPLEQGRLAHLTTKLAESEELLPALFLEKNLGKGGAIRAGWEHAQDAKWVCFVDADGAILPNEIRRLLEIAAQPNEEAAIFGSRIKMLGKKVERTFLRHCMGRVFALLVGLLITPQIYDSQCGIKIIPGAAYRKVKGRLRENGFGFDVELLAALLDEGIPIREVPIDWKDQAGSKVSIVRDTIRLYAGLQRIRRRRRAWMS
ncbi:MAG TPA: glycosyltransferase [Chthoniobacterales bacterium]